MRLHEGERALECDECGEHFVRKVELGRHIKEFHPDLEILDKCGSVSCTATTTRVDRCPVKATAQVSSQDHTEGSFPGHDNAEVTYPSQDYTESPLPCQDRTEGLYFQGWKIS